MERFELIENMSARVMQCRRLAAHTEDEQTRIALAAMANEIEADIARLLVDKFDS